MYIMILNMPTRRNQVNVQIGLIDFGAYVESSETNFWLISERLMHDGTTKWKKTSIMKDNSKRNRALCIRAITYLALAYMLLTRKLSGSVCQTMLEEG